MKSVLKTSLSLLALLTLHSTAQQHIRRYDKGQQSETRCDEALNNGIRPYGTTRNPMEIEKPILDLREDGTCKRIRFPRDSEDIVFQSDTLQGPSLQLTENGKTNFLPLNRTGDGQFGSIVAGVRYALSYELGPDAVFVKVEVENCSHVPFEPDALSLVMGLSNYMVSYPQWNNIYFPTLLRCEKTHFWGYLMNPDGHVLSISCPEPVASWHHYYNYGYGDRSRFWWGHRIYTFGLDLIHRLPLPERHPQGQYRLGPLEKRSWVIRLKREKSLKEISPSVSRFIRAPVFAMDRTSFGEGDRAEWKVYAGHSPRLEVLSPDGNRRYLQPEGFRDNAFLYHYLPSAGPGVYKILATDHGKVSEACISVLHSYDWYMRRGMAAALEYPQRMGLSCENWYGFHTLFEGLRLFPDSMIARRAEEAWNHVIPMGYDTLKGRPIRNPTRIQNTAATLSMYVDRYRLYHRIGDLRLAADLADWLIDSTQSPDGAFRKGRIHYTSVLYLAKSIMELMSAEDSLKDESPGWKAVYDRHDRSVRRAIHQLSGGARAIDTEGQLTFEDGMVSCTALQIAYFTLVKGTGEERDRYTKIAADLVDQHRCLTGLLVPDSRMRGGTLRFWEGQYNLLTYNNFISSPHGWSAWKAYATYYLYLLTGREDYLVQTMNTLNTCLQVVDNRTGNLRWGFMVDPYVELIQSSGDIAQPDFSGYVLNTHHPLEVPVRKWTAGEQYMDLVNNHISLTATDNDVHEIFKCLDELVLDKAYLFQKKDGAWITWNCKAVFRNGILSVRPSSSRIRSIHINASRKVFVKLPARKKIYAIEKGMNWIKV
ncbi:MAG: hypothetical protein P4L51_13095 [Puia sp.]|nr:hypothetical protein [Puia sp.]